jgi:hypothetical protein
LQLASIQLLLLLSSRCRRRCSRRFRFRCRFRYFRCYRLPLQKGPGGTGVGLQLDFARRQPHPGKLLQLKHRHIERKL